LAQAMTHPSHEVNKIYEVTVPGIVPQEKLDLLRIGVKLEDGMTAPAIVDLVGYDYEKNLTRFNVAIHEGRNRQVRRMCDYIGFPVRYLRRVQMGTLTLDGLRRGDCRELFNEEIEDLRAACGLKREQQKEIKPVKETKPERTQTVRGKREQNSRPKRNPNVRENHEEAKGSKRATGFGQTRKGRLSPKG